MPGLYLPSENEFDPSLEDFVIPALSKERQYSHFDLPLTDEERAAKVDMSASARVHRFLPLLGYTDVTLSFKPDSKGKKSQKKKERPIRFAGHRDSAYLQAYGNHLSAVYESKLNKDGISASVLAYRPSTGTNIDHANSLFSEIRMRKDCVVVALDISGFFDCLDHEHLKSEVARLLGTSWLEGHHGTVWKNVTRYSWVETTDLDKLLGKKRLRQGRICTPYDFKQHVRGTKHGLVRVHDLKHGIPQGTPVSGLYANIYMRSFDKILASECYKLGGSYRRYSDDIAIVLPHGSKVSRTVHVVEKLLADFGLAMSEGKTDSATFSNGKLATNKPIQYLGFTFDGDSTLIRASSLDAYRKKMRTGIHAKMVAAKMQSVDSLEVYKRECLSRYTHLGKRRNFIRYAYTAADKLGSDEIRKQVRKHMTWFNRCWEAERQRVFGDLVTLA